MKRPKFTRFTAAVHFVEGLEAWARQRGAAVYPEVIPGGAERYPFVSIETNNVALVDETKDGGPDRLDYEMTITVMVKERAGSGQEHRNELADEIVDIMDNTVGEHDGFAVAACKWTGAAPGYDEQRAAYFMEMSFTIEAIKRQEANQYPARLGQFVLGRARLGIA